MHRRDLLTGLALLSFAPSAIAQRRNDRYFVATLWTKTRTIAAPYLDQFEAGLRERGWIPGETLTLVNHFTDGQPDRLAPLAAEIVATRPDVIMSGLATGAVALRKLTSEIPIVVGISVDPIAVGLAKSIAQPGGNVTGSMIPYDVVSKRVQMIREIAPRTQKIAVVHNSSAPNVAEALQALIDAGREFNIDVHLAPLSAPQDLPLVLQNVVASKCDAIFILPNDNLAFLLRGEIVAAALRHRIATMVSSIETVREGALVAYGPSISTIYRRSAYFVDRVLRGARPAELPFEQPARYELAVNRQTARALGLTIPLHILATADEVID